MARLIEPDGTRRGIRLCVRHSTTLPSLLGCVCNSAHFTCAPSVRTCDLSYYFLGVNVIIALTFHEICDCSVAVTRGASRDMRVECVHCFTFIFNFYLVSTIKHNRPKSDYFSHYNCRFHDLFYKLREELILCSKIFLRFNIAPCAL
jgi:hypothetical protein